MAVNSKLELKKNTAKLLQVLPVLESLTSQGEITSERYGRVSLAMTHLLIELHLLVTLMEDK